MRLKDLVIPSEVVKIPVGTVGEFVDYPVRAITPADVMWLLQEQRAALEEFYAKAVSGELATDDYNAMAQQLLTGAPLLLGAVIACAGGERDREAAENAAALSFTVQVDALEKIGRLTFAAEGGAKKFLETVIKMMEGMTATQESLPPLPSGLGVFGGR